MTQCPSCPRTWSTETALAAHLIDDHGLAPRQAAERARLVMEDARRQARRAAKKAARTGPWA